MINIFFFLFVLVPHFLVYLPLILLSFLFSLFIPPMFRASAHDSWQGGFVGRMFDLYGPRPLMIAGTLCYVTSIVMTSVCVKFYQYLLAQGLLFGLGVGLMSVMISFLFNHLCADASWYRFYPALSSVATHFVKYRATALGIAVAGSSVGLSSSSYFYFLNQDSHRWRRLSHRLT